MSDPRETIPDIILDAPDGSRYLTRCSQLLVQAERDQPVRIIIDALIMPVLSVDENGRARCLPVPVGRQGFEISLTDLPAELAAAVAQWMAAQAAPLGQRILDKLYPSEAV